MEAVVAEVPFTSLRPLCGQASYPSGCAIRLAFDCPVCGPPFRIDIPIVINGQGANLQPEIPKWTASTNDAPDRSNSGWEHLTVTPSIDNSPGGHGRKKPCAFHGSIVDGKVVFP